MTSDKLERKPPNPGSDEAVAMGCKCPVLDNSRGKGWMQSGHFWISGDCPLHARGAIVTVKEDEL